MAEHSHTDAPSDSPENWPALGRALSWVERPGNPMRIVRALAAAGAVVALADFTFERHGYVDMEHLPAFYAVFGFVGFSALIFLAKALRVLVKRPEDYYAPKAVDSEAYPPDQLEIRDHGH